MYFVDTSALIKAYIGERGSATVHEAFRILDGSLCVSDLVLIETLSTLARLLRRREISRRTYARARDDLRNHARTRYYVAPLPESVLATATRLVETYRSRRVGGSDLIHVATAEHLQSLVPAETVCLMCSDGPLAKVAAERGFDVFDPERHSTTDVAAPDLFGR